MAYRPPKHKFLHVKSIIWVVLVIALTGGVLLWTVNFWPQKQELTPVSVPPAEETPEPEEKRARFLAVGDMLIHDDVYQDHETADGYDFRPAFSEVAPIIETGDFVMLNQETPLGGVEIGLSGFYVANSPQELGEAEAEIGFNIIQLANNHIWDRGQKGLEQTLAFWEQYDDIITTGAYLTEASRDKVPIIERSGIKLAVLSYTYGSNRGPTSHSYNVNLLDEKLIAADVNEAKKLADFVVVGVHWGIERESKPSAQQRQLAQDMADMGVDVIIGTHPHVLQPPEWIDGKGGNQTFVMYSLGNFLSVHTERVPHTLTGAIAGLDFVIDDKGQKNIENPFAVLTWNYFDKSYRNFRIIPFESVKQKDFWVMGNSDFANYKQEYEEFFASKTNITYPSLDSLLQQNSME